MSAEELPLPAAAALPASPQTAPEEHTAGPSWASQASSGRGDRRERDNHQLARSADCQARSTFPRQSRPAEPYSDECRRTRSVSQARNQFQAAMAQLQPLAADAELQVGTNLLGLQESFRAARRGTPASARAWNTGCLKRHPDFPAHFFRMLTLFWELGVRLGTMCTTSASRSRLIVCAQRQDCHCRASCRFDARG